MAQVESIARDTSRVSDFQAQTLARFIDAAKLGEGALKADYVALKRLDPDAEALTVQQIAALTRALHRAKVDCEQLSVERWKRWAVIVNGIALTGHSAPKKNAEKENAPKEQARFGHQLRRADVSDARVTRLFNARGDAFFPLLQRVLRLMESRKVAPNWAELGTFVLNEGAEHPMGKRRAERLRIRFVQDHASAAPEGSKKP
ncbi:CRISPR-associated protein Cse2 (CRISPR_cse2) [Caballeronia fortuita]|uniref:CRISPR-associated protein Cse2 (CRISPR_cse2) n=1 Tax=Caballeronia fortuita TaxID=1777138 RepID=A0A158BDI8_9BURK|nr:type I-E CRISPR-associated protein Cse2/CasB [Caballeronia fortuita]SAK68128.1 CRISPR-associated protein Cse2 (CRISPR_cse2) [Caballeronia fortuita]